MNILALIKHVKLHNQKAKLKAIYFSASSKTLSTVLPELEPLWKAEFDGLIQIITRTDVKPFVEANGCIGVPTEDSLETTEMELCYRASAFLRFGTIQNCSFFFLNSILEHNTQFGVAQLILSGDRIDNEHYLTSYLPK